MKILLSIILGLIQGLTEFLPVSSSGHLVLAEHFLGFTRPDISFEIALHIGSLIAVLYYFRKEIVDLTLSLFIWTDDRKKDRMFVLYLMVATFFTGIIGVMFSDFFESLFSKPMYSALFLSLTGLIVFASDKITTGKLTGSNVGILKSIGIGLGQSFAILPGISRSGTTIATGIYFGLERKEAARFSFLLSIPAILGSVVLKIKDFQDLPKNLILSYSAGAIAAFVSGLLVISVLIKLVQNKKLKYFAFYCWGLSILSIILLLLGL